MKKLFVFWFIVILQGCTTPAQRFDQTAEHLGFETEIINGTEFRHKVFFIEADKNSVNSKTLHVYLDGDGTPWERNRWIASDPTARNPLILRLMKLDSQPSILLGRPCYHGLQQDEYCHHTYWTSHRYSKEVVQSMSKALNQWLSNKSFQDIVLIGYSGGGSLAVLMADKINNIDKVVTLAANLDINAWAEFHGYKALSGSLNPMDLADLNIKQYHFAGKDDEIVPSSIIKTFAKKQDDSEYYEIVGSDHACCWEKEWQKILTMTYID